MAQENLTDWYTPDTKPIRPGVYRVTPIVRNAGRYSLWTGQHWCIAGTTVRYALSYGRRSKSAFQNRAWCGLAEEPKL